MSPVTAEQSVTYDPADYWSAVGDRVRRRGDASVLAGEETPFQHYKREAFIDRLLGAMNLAGRSVLEVGCGPGGNLLEVAARGARRVVGCDIAPTMIGLATERTADLPQVSCVQLDGKGLPFGDGEFDVVFTVTVLQHNQDPEVRRLLTEMCRVAGSSIHLLEDVGARRHDFSASYVIRRPREYAAICEPLGFGLISTQRLNVFASEVVYFLLNRRLHGSSGRPEGEPIGRSWASVERRALSATRWLDDRIGARIGLARMEFAPLTRSEEPGRQ
jgi:SAM-dependent methyltransferase